MRAAALAVLAAATLAACDTAILTTPVPPDAQSATSGDGGAPVDPAGPTDLASPADLLPTPDLTLLSDSGVTDIPTPDLLTPPDLASPDLSSPDLSSPDLSSPDLAGPDVASPDLRSEDLAILADLRVNPDLTVSADLACPPRGTPFIDRVVAFLPGPNGGFNQDKLPAIIQGPPVGGGPQAGSIDVVSLGKQGEIVIAFDDLGAVDGPGPDLIVFENAFGPNKETAFVAASKDGIAWREWPCAPADVAGNYPSCAGVHPVLSNPQNALSPVDPAAAGGDAFDLKDVGLSRARYVRLRDSGRNNYAGTTGGFDLDAIAIVNAAPIGCP